MVLLALAVSFQAFALGFKRTVVGIGLVSAGNAGVEATDGDVWFHVVVITAESGAGNRRKQNQITTAIKIAISVANTETTRVDRISGLCASISSCCSPLVVVATRIVANIFASNSVALLGGCATGSSLREGVRCS